MFWPGAWRPCWQFLMDRIHFPDWDIWEPGLWMGTLTSAWSGGGRWSQPLRSQRPEQLNINIQDCGWPQPYLDVLQTAGECDELGVEHNVCPGEVHIVENRVPVIRHSELGLVQGWDLSSGCSLENLLSCFLVIHSCHTVRFLKLNHKSGNKLLHVCSIKGFVAYL